MEKLIEDLSLKAIGLYFLINSGNIGAIDIVEDEEYKEAFVELWSKNYLEFTVK